MYAVSLNSRKNSEHFSKSKLYQKSPDEAGTSKCDVVIPAFV